MLNFDREKFSQQFLSQHIVFEASYPNIIFFVIDQVLNPFFPYDVHMHCIFIINKNRLMIFTLGGIADEGIDRFILPDTVSYPTKAISTINKRRYLEDCKCISNVQITNVFRVLH